MKKNEIIYYALIVGIIVLSFYPILNAGYITWDDGDYINNNPDIKIFSIENIKNIFTSIYLGNYQPISVLSYMPDYILGNGSPLNFHITNLILHIFNSYIIFSLTKKLSQNTSLSFFVTLLYTIHPMQVESVAWIAERKNLLYGMFYWLSVYFFVLYLKAPNKKLYVFCISAFLLSLLSKGQAVSLPLSLIGIIYLSEHHQNIKPLMIKLIPFFILSLIFGVIAIYAQSQHGYINTSREHDIAEKASMFCSGYIMYVYKILLPVNLSALYPIPAILPWYYLLSIPVIIAFAYFIIWCAIKNRNRKLIGVVLLFSSNIIFILHIIPVGEAIIADRYAYIAIWPLAYYIVSLAYQTFKEKKDFALFLGVLIIAVFSFLTLKRSYIWQNNISLFTDVIRKYPNSEIGLNSLGAAYSKISNYPVALKYINKAILIDSLYFQAYYNKAVIYRQQKNNDSSLFFLNKTLKIQPLYKDAYLLAGIIYKDKKMYAEAIMNFKEYLKYDSGNGEVFYNTGLCYDLSGNSSAAIPFYINAITLNYKEEYVYLNRAIAYGNIGDFSSSLRDLDVVLKKNPTNGQANYLKAISLFNTGKNGCEFLRIAIQHNYLPAKYSLNKYCP